MFFPPRIQESFLEFYLNKISRIPGGKTNYLFGSFTSKFTIQPTPNLSVNIPK